MNAKRLQPCWVCGKPAVWQLTARKLERVIEFGACETCVPFDLAHVTQAGAASSQRQISGEVVDAAAAPVPKRVNLDADPS